jgi:septum formation topological specificity factor MinE
MTTRQRLLFYLYGAPNIIGSLPGLGGLALYFLGIIHDFWFLIVVGLYGIGVLATPKNPTYQVHLRNEMTADEIRAELERLVAGMRKRVPKEIFVMVESIKNSILEILPRIVDINSSDYNICTIRQTALEYLPETIESYLKLPKAYASIHPVKNGKTANQLLSEQQNLLDGEMKAIVDDFYRNDTQRLMAHGKFLQGKFGKSMAW